jgi:hypothetical protein
VYVTLSVSPLATVTVELKAASDHRVPLLDDFVLTLLIKIPFKVADALHVKSTVLALVIVRAAAAPGVQAGRVALE